MKQPNRLMIMAGGTGGHVFPGIAVAQHMITQGWKVRWLGTQNHLEAKLVPKHDIEIDFISISGLRGKNIKASLITLKQFLSAYNRTRYIMKQFSPDVVLGMGGYVSGPGGLAARSLKIPIILHEQNSVAGLTNKWLSKISKKVLQAFPGAFSNAKVVGNPIRLDLLNLPKPEDRLRYRKGPLRVLVIGGSQGARFLNQTMPKVAKRLGTTITLWHQSGKGAKREVKEAYFNSNCLQYKVTEFIDDMAKAYSWADIAVCRSGALTVSEISAVGLPAIFIPFRHKDLQQYWNALPLEKIGAARIFEQSQYTSSLITSALSSLNREVLLTMAKRAYSLASLGATEKIAKELYSIKTSCIFKHQF